MGPTRCEMTTMANQPSSSTSDRIIVTWPRQEGRKRGPSEIALTSVIDCG